MGMNGDSTESECQIIIQLISFEETMNDNTQVATHSRLAIGK
jgi:hypothetical protein